jgi:hypothetical protein
MQPAAVVAVQLVTGLECAMHPLSTTRPPGRMLGRWQAPPRWRPCWRQPAAADPGRGGGAGSRLGECAAGLAVAFTTDTGLRVLTSCALYQPAAPTPIAGKPPWSGLTWPAVSLPVA